jgi:hypothetical protein
MMKLKEILISLFKTCSSYNYKEGVVTWDFNGNPIASELASVLWNKFHSQSNWTTSQESWTRDSLSIDSDIVGDRYLTGSISYIPKESFAKEVLEEVLYNKMSLIKNPCAEIQLGEPTTCLREEPIGKILNMKPEMKEMIRVKLNGETFDLSIEGCEQRTIEHILSICVEDISTLTTKINELNEASTTVNKTAAYALINALENQRNLYGEIFERVGGLPIKDA